ncbi:MAG TPA: fructosamine kinase family protein, partial [Polyangia bacterium]
MLSAALAAVIGRVLGSAVTGSRPLAGGDINQAFAVALADGRQVFLKTNARAPRTMFAAEARSLTWLAETGALRVPRVLAASASDDLGPAYLLLELLQPGPPARDFHETLGRGLATLHQAGAPRFGLDHDNFIGRLPQSNQSIVSRNDAGWAAFYRARRLEPQLKLAVDNGHASLRMRQGMERLLDQLSSLVGPAEPPSRLHGDLWGGNLMCADDGQPCLIDPAPYGGHREVDLAMMRLFGG